MTPMMATGIELYRLSRQLGGESFVNNLPGDPTSHTDANGNVTTFAYDNRREMTNTIAPTNLTIKVSFDAVGNVSGNTDARGNAATKTWSATRHLLATTLPSTPQGVPIITNAYDSRDLLVKIVDPLQNPTLYTNDVAGRLISQTDPVLRTTTIGYDADGRKLAATNAAQEATSQTWDARQYVATDRWRRPFVNPRLRCRWQPDHAHQPQRQKMAVPIRRRKPADQYHHAARLLDITCHSIIRDWSTRSKTKPTSPHPCITMPKGQLTNRTDNVATTLYGFDANGNRTSATENGQTNSWTYDAYNQLPATKTFTAT